MSSGQLDLFPSDTYLKAQKLADKYKDNPYSTLVIQYAYGKYILSVRTFSSNEVEWTTIDGDVSYQDACMIVDAGFAREWFGCLNRVVSHFESNP